MIGADPANRVAVQPDRFVTDARIGALAVATSPGTTAAPPVRRTALDGLLAPVDAASLAAFRIAFGVLLLWEVWKFFANGWIARYYVDPSFHFTYSYVFTIGIFPWLMIAATLLFLPPD